MHYFKLSGVCRFNFATCLARNATNKGGLQEIYFGSSCNRSAAHEYVVRSLEQIYPDLIRYDASLHNKCSFLAPRGEPRALEHVCVDCGKTYARKNDLLHHRTWAHNQGGTPEIIECPECKKRFKTKKAMMTHLKGQKCDSKRGRPYNNIPPQVI